MSRQMFGFLSWLVVIVLLMAACAPAAAPTQAPTAGQAAPAGKDAAAPAQAPAQAKEAAKPAEPKRGGILRYGLVGDPPTLDPHVQRGAADATVKNLVYNRLLTWDKDQKVVAELAEKWELNDPTNITLTLRKGVMFQNGEELTAEDVKFSFERIQDPKVGASSAGVFRDIKVEAPDKYTVKMTLPRPNAAIFQNLARTDALIVNKKWVQSGVKVDQEMMGTGAFKYKGREPNVSFEVVRYDNYWRKGLPYLDGIKFVPYEDETAKVTAFRTGEMDFIDYVPWRNMDSIQKDAKDGKLKFESDSHALFMTFYMNPTVPPFNDKRVRQAISWAIDRDAIGRSVFFGRGEAMTGSFIPKPFVGYDASLDKTYGFDQAKAKQLLADAGWKDSNGDGVLDKDGQPFRINMLATNLYAMHYSMAELAQAQLKEIGIDGKVELVDWPTRVKRRTKVEPFEIQADGLGQAISDPAFMNDYYHSVKGVWPKQLPLKDAEVDAWLDKAQETYDEKERAKLYNQVDKKMLDEAYFIYVWRREQGEAMYPYVMGFYHMFSVNSYLVMPEVWLNK